MTTSGIPPALQEKNEQEFVEVTRRIQEALARIESDTTLKATQGVLAKLADCSRGTLNNRKWPLDHLRKIKATRKTPVQITVNETIGAAQEEARIERYKQQLYDSRDEVLVWKTRHDDAVRQLTQALHLNQVLQAKLATAEEEIFKLRGTSTAKVVKMPPKRPK